MTRLGAVIVAAVAVVLTVSGHSGAAAATRYAVGLDERADAKAVEAAIESHGGRVTDDLAPIRALVVTAPADTHLDRIRGVRYVEPLVSRRLTLTPTDPFVSRQWYLTQSHFYESWETYPAFESVPVAVIDSGVDASHPELAGKILDAKSFVGGSARVDALGHGTFVAGLVAAGVDNGVGIAGLAPSAQLLVAKVVTKSRSIPVVAEAQAIRWAVENGARVINMSLGGLRDPLDPDRDSFSQLEADAVAYAVANGAVVVAAVGNDDQAPDEPVAVCELPGSVAARARRELSHPERLGAQVLQPRPDLQRPRRRPAEQILSIFPRPLTSRFPACTEQGFSSCGPDEYREAQGTSFSAPQVSAAAAVLLSLHPDAQARASHGDPPALRGGRELGRTGARRVRRAVTRSRAGDAWTSPPRSPRCRTDFRFATGTRRTTTSGPRSAGVSGRNRRIKATVDFWDDQDDVYAIRLRKGQAVYLGLTAADRERRSEPGSVASADALDRRRPQLPHARTYVRPSRRPRVPLLPRPASRHVLHPGADVRPGYDRVPARDRQGLTSVGGRDASTARRGARPREHRAGRELGFRPR